MNLQEIKHHWESWAKQYSTDLRATTKTSTIKKLEINAIANAIRNAGFGEAASAEVLEVGCGNGYNCFAISSIFPRFSVTGIDYVPEMVDHAKEILRSQAPAANLAFHVGDALNLDKNTLLKDSYDIIFTDRCIINLNSHELQFDALRQVISKTKQNGHIIILENFIQARQRQNELRRSVNLPERKAPEYNHFIDEEQLVSFAKAEGLELLSVDDFGSLHDIILYVLTPMVNNGEIDYDHPMVAAATELCLSTRDQKPDAFGKFGQNRLFLFKKK
jgi:SAM-dependent methyltransferase